MKNTLLLISALTIFASCSSAQKQYDGNKIISSSSGSSERAFWTMDGGFEIEKLRSHFNDDKKKPAFAYFISQASVSKADLIPNCYNMARARAASEASSSISDNVKEASAMAITDSNTEFNKMIETQSKNMLVGASIVDKTWFKVDSEDSNPYKCYVALKVPRKNLERVQEKILSALEKELSGDKAMVSQVKDSVEKRMQENF